MPKSFALFYKSRLLKSISVLALASMASASSAHAQTANVAPAANVTPSNVNVLNLLSPFLGLNATQIGRTTLTDNLAQAIAINNGATLPLEELAYSDKNLLGSASNTVTGISGSFGVAANLAGGLPDQPPATGGTVPGVQPVGGYGATLGAIYDTGVNAYAAGTSTALTNTVNLLATAYGTYTSSDLGAAKFYFANGTTNGTKTAVAPSGYTLPTFNGLPNTTNNVYDTAYGVKNTDPGQNIYGSSRPIQVRPPTGPAPHINAFDPTAISGLTTNPSFPSGHTTYAYTDSILLGMLTPELYQSMLSRGSQFANSRIVLGVHYPLDIIASRSLASYDLAQAFTNPDYINNAATTGTAINLPGLFTSAAPELNSYLTAGAQAAGCGNSVASCAASQVNPYAPSAANAATYANNLTYGLPTLTFKQAPQQAAPAGGPDASILLATLYGGSSTTAQALANAANGGTDGSGLLGSLSTNTINQIIVNTETNALAAFYGTPLSYWSRINLYGAAGYFQGVTGSLTLASTDTVKTDVTIDATGTLGGTGTIAGNVTNAGGALKPGGAAPGVLTITGNLTESQPSALDILLGGTTPGTEYSQLIVDGKASLLGSLDLALVDGFSLSSGETFDIVGTGDGLTNGLTALSLDGAACWGSGGGFECNGGSVFDHFALSTVPGALVGGGMNPENLVLSVTTTPVPEPSTWAMILAGFAGIGFLTYRASRKTAAA
jgi:subtilase-type serine protease